METNSLSKEVKIALEFAKEAHFHQFRKNSYLPYIVHPIAVMMKFNELCTEFIRENYQFDDYILNVMQSALLVHDVFEDTTKTKKDLIDAYAVIPRLENFAEQVWNVAGVGLTDTSKVLFPHCNRAERKAIDGARIASIDIKWASLVHMGKMCDIMCNVSDYVREHPEYAIKYIGEKQKFAKFLIHLPNQFQEMLVDFLDKAKDEAYGRCFDNGIKL